MKDNSLDGHRGKVAVSDTSRVTTAGSSVKCDLKTSVTTAASDGAATTNFDDDYNEWELGIGDLIIDLDADIEKTNTNHHHHHHQNGTVVGNSPGASTAVSPSSVGAASFAFLGSQSCTPAMSNSKSSRLISGTNNSGSAGSTTGGTSVSANSTGGTAGAVEHQATVDKGLKMKIKRKTVGNKYSEAKHEIVQSDTKSVPAHPLCENMASSNTASGQNSVPSSETKSKHSSSKGRTSSHRDKKEKNRDKDKSANTKAVNSSAEVNGAMSAMSPSLKITNSGVSMSPLTPSSGASTITQNGSIVPSLPQTSTSCRSVPTSSCNSNCSSSSNSSSTSSNSVTSSATAIQEPAQMSCPAPPACSPPMPNLTLKLENKFTTGQPSVVVKQEDRLSPPLKKMRTDDSDKVDTACSPVPPEMKDTSTCTSVGTITEPDCLGPCEPGTSVMLEGIVWQETEGGVLVVNVTWRGKTYVGTLLDCTKHDWAPPRFCESPTSDVDSKTSKGRGKRGRGSNNNAVDVNAYNDARNCVQSKLRNGKGRRTTVNSSNSNSGFTVPSSPAKSDNGVPTNNKRKGRPSEVEVSTPQMDNKSSKRSRSQSRGTPTPSSSISAAEFSQPSSPVLIECPEPNCSKKYKHINGLRYHQTHAHSGLDGSKLEDSNSEDIKDATNSSDNEESIQESMSVPPSPAMSFRNSASPRPTSGRTLQGENTSSLSCSSLPESDPYSLTPDLSTLASVAISDSKAAQKSESVSKATPPHPATTPELTPVVSSEAVKTPSILPAMTFSASQCPSSPVSVPPAISTESAPSISVPVPAVTTTSVIHSPDSMDVSVVSPSVTVSIPTSHVVLSQGITVGGNSVTTTTHTTSTVVCHSPAAVVSRSNLAPATTTTTSFVSVPPLPITSTTTLCSSPITSVGDKSKIKQDKLEKYKPKSPLATAPAIRPIVPAPSPQLITLSTNMPVSHPTISPGSHNLVTSSLKPIQPKPTILGEPPTISPALESLKKEKSKHKKKSKDKDKEKEKKTSVQMPPASVRHVSSHGGEECEAMDITPYPNLEAVPGTRDSLNATVSLPPASHTSMSPLPNQPKPSDSVLDMNVADDNMNENIQSPAYSDISDANDTAPVLESEVPSGKEKEDKVGKSTPDTPQSPAANISAYGMYPYYSQPPYLLPSVSPQNSVPGPQMASVTDKPESSKKLEQDRIKENRPWSNSSGEISRERQSAVEHDPSEKKSMRGEENTPSSSVIPSPSSSATIQDYPMQQHYPYSYGYVQNYQYSVEPSYHMQLLETDPHYKQQYKQYIEEQQRLYKEQHHHHHHQQQQQHSHHSHSQQHHSSHQSKSQHHSSSSSSSVKEERREKERPMPEKLSSSGMVMDHSGKQQHSSLSLVVNKEHDAPRDPETRPPSLPAQARVDSSTPSSASAAAALKEKQNENHQILKENIELKSQMDASKNKVNQYEMAMLYERHRDDMRRYYIFQERLMEQQQQQHQQHKVESEQQQQQQQQHHHHHHMSPHPSSLSSSLKSHKDEVVALSSSQSKPNHFTEGSRSSVISPPKSDHIKCSTSQPNSTSSPKTSVREPPVSIPKEYSSSSGITGSSSKKESSSSSKAPVERLDSSVREEKNKSDKSKVEVKVEPEGQKPTMETTGPPPPPTNSYAYLHPSYLPPAPPHFPHMPFEAAHAVYRGGINPMLMSSPHYSSSPYVHQLRYPTPAACDLPAPSQPVDPLGNKLHAPGPGKALDLLHQVSHYTTHKIHELQEHALMSPTPTSTPSSTPSTSSNAANKVSSTEPVMTVAKVESGATRDSSRSPPTQRHLHTHHHTHVGVGYPIYDPYGGLRKPCS